METPSATPACLSCGKPVEQNSYFCPNCGKKIKEPPPSTHISSQIGIYLIALLAPPFGLIPAIKYLRSNDHNAKIIGYFAVLLTVISLSVAIWITLGFINQLNSSTSLQQLYDIQN